MKEIDESGVLEKVDRGTTVPVRPGVLVSGDDGGGIGDSPWLWLLLFAGFGMFGLFAISSKYQARQTAIEQEFQGIRHMQDAESDEVLGKPPAAEQELTDGSQTSLMITLRPLFLVLGTAAIGGWIALLWRSSLGGPSRDEGGPETAENAP